MIDVVVSLLWTAHAMLKTEVEARQKMGVIPSKMIAALHAIEAAALTLKNEDASTAIAHTMEALK